MEDYKMNIIKKDLKSILHSTLIYDKLKNTFYLKTLIGSGMFDYSFKTSILSNKIINKMQKKTKREIKTLKYEILGNKSE